jgi:hypothetical protein
VTGSLGHNASLKILSSPLFTDHRNHLTLCCLYTDNIVKWPTKINALRSLTVYYFNVWRLLT